jgi:hypothetical protein
MRDTPTVSCCGGSACRRMVAWVAQPRSLHTELQDSSAEHKYNTQATKRQHV